MKIFAISDTHFGHTKLVDYGRPTLFSNIILANLQREKGDILIHCGDFCIGSDEEWHHHFMLATDGFKKKILVRGNHDGKSDSWYYDHGWDFVCESFSHTMFGKNFIFTHIPMLPTEAVKTRFFKNIHGHMHGNTHRHVEQYDTDFHFDLAPEIRNYKAVNVETIK